LALQRRYAAERCAGRLRDRPEAVSRRAIERTSPTSREIRQPRALELFVRLRAELRAATPNLSTAIVFGLGFATVLTLVVTPAALMGIENMRLWRIRTVARLRGLFARRQAAGL
jgi:hypothetical protein